MAANFWRINTSAVTSGTVVQLAEVEFRATVGGADQANNGTPVASSYYIALNAYASNAFDNSAPTYWSSADGSTLPQWIGYQFIAPVTVAQVSITCRSAGQSAAPKDFTIDWSNDGVTWTTAATFTGEVFTSGQTKLYAVTDNSGTYPLSARLSQLPVEVFASYPAAARLSHLPVEVFAQYNAEIRVAQTYVEILVPNNFYLVKQTLTFSQLVIGEIQTGEIFERDRTSEISLASTVDCDAILNLSADNILTLDDSAITGIIDTETVTDILVITDTNTFYNNRRVGNTLHIVQSVAHTKDKGGLFTSNLSITQVTTVNKFVTHTVAHRLALSQSVSYKRGLVTRSVTSSLPFSDTATGFRNPRNTLHLIQSVVGVKGGTPLTRVSTLTLVQEALVNTVLNRPLNSQLNLTNVSSRNTVTVRTLTSTLYLTYYTLPLILGTKKYLILQAPFNAIESSIVLPNPLLDDTENLVSDVVLKKSMNNVTRTFVKRTLGRRLKYTVRMVRLKSLELEQFLRDHNSDSIRLQNWKGEVWKVHIVNNPIEFVQTGKWFPGGDRTEVNLEFEGVRIN